MTRYFVPGLIKSERKALDMAGCGEYALPGISDATKLSLLKRGLIEPCGEKIICQDRFGTVKVDEFCMPVSVHIRWCEWCAAQPDQEEEELKPKGRIKSKERQ